MIEQFHKHGFFSKLGFELMSFQGQTHHSPVRIFVTMPVCQYNLLDHASILSEKREAFHGLLLICRGTISMGTDCLATYLSFQFYGQNCQSLHTSLAWKRGTLMNPKIRNKNPYLSRLEIYLL